MLNTDKEFSNENSFFCTQYLTLLLSLYFKYFLILYKNPMKEIIIQAVYTILGINAASGLIYTDDTIYAVSDQSNVLYEFAIDENQTYFRSLDNDTINHKMVKNEKYDIEGIVLDDSTIFMIGSGSTPTRNLAFLYDIQSQATDTLNLEYLYQTIAEFSEIDEEDFNIEGVVKYKEDYIFLNRGNGPKNSNALLFVQGRNFIDDFNTFTHTIELPKINGVSSGFSDGIVVNNTLFFLATAENKNSTYHDGEIKGSMIGAIDLKKMKLKFTKVISNNKKFEGIALRNLEGKKIEFLLCEDRDSLEENSSTIYSLKTTLRSKP